ncbi:hypothetical protein GCM10022631_01480 [Deinococcus rubellus]|uniref:Uncharacterized protein n=1 Tax=Deinococcus rubellus TaxID=1889240 RepID=A0ABY5YHY7_9DEIO|nr:hypothetical protein [Deinococcus rubellus]UWX64728.1 hypothetical protein N0D28_03455 [Deinococcus rubellus]
MLRFDLPAARLAATTTLGRGAETILGQLEAAGLVVIKRADLPNLDAAVRTLLDVEDIVITSEWEVPYACEVIPNAKTGGRTLELVAVVDAVAGVREARLLREVMGGTINVEIDEARGLLLRAWREEE